MNTMSAPAMAASTSVEKNRLRPRASATTSASPGSYTGSWERSASFQAAIRFSFMSTILTVIWGHFWAITDIVGPPTYPAPMQQIFFIFILYYFNEIFHCNEQQRYSFNLNVTKTTNKKA